VASKILAGVFAIAVLTVGGYTYWYYSDSPGESSCRQPSGEPAQITVPLPCCQEPTRASCLQPADVPCCKEDDSPVAPETLAIAPREVK
jgi:hypothetical protein